MDAPALGEKAGEVVFLPLSPLGVVAERAFLGECVGDVDDGRRDRLPAKVLGRAVAHVARKDGAVGGCQDLPQLEET